LAKNSKYRKLMIAITIQYMYSSLTPLAERLEKSGKQPARSATGARAGGN
jgi:hypothetical protein